MLEQLFEIGCRGYAGGDGKVDAVRLIRQLHRALELGFQKAQGSHAVFKLGVFLVKLIRRQLALGLDVQLITAEEDAAAVFMAAFFREALHQVECLPRMLLCEGREGIAIFAVFGQTHRHDGHAVHRRPEGFQLPHGAEKLRPVVESRAADDLAVHDDARLCKAAHDVDGLASLGVAQHVTAKLRVHGVHRHIDGTHMQGDDALHLAVGEVCERDVVSEKKAQSRVVVLKIHGFAHAAGQLVNEAEDTGISAGARRVHEVAFKVQPQVAALGFLDMQRIARPVRPLQDHFEFPVIGEELVIEHVEDLIAVDGHYRVPDLHAPMQRTRRIDRLYIIVFHPGSLLSRVIAGRQLLYAQPSAHGAAWFISFCFAGVL